jgi:CheY-like chemotaxis protein
VKVLIVDDEPATAKLISAILVKAGHEVEVLGEGRRAMIRLDDEPFDALVCDLMLTDVEGTAVVRHVRGKSTEQPAIVLTSCASAPEIRAHAIRMGADELLAKPVAGPALLAVLSAAVEQRARAKVHAHPVGRCVAWREVGRRVTGKLGECTGLPFAVAPPADAPLPHRAALFMLDVTRDTELAVALFASPETGALLARSMLNESRPSKALVTEILAELCNNACGLLKSSMRDDGFIFTMGLPTFDVPVAAELARTLPLASRFAMRTGDAHVEVVVGARAAPVHTVATSQLSEAMVLAEDVHTATGLVVAARGSRITTLSRSRIARHASKRVVRVCFFPQERSAAPLP